MTLIRNILITLARGLHGRFGFLPESERRNFSKDQKDHDHNTESTTAVASSAVEWTSTDLSYN